MVESHALVPDTGGAGRNRGGLGVERVVRVLAPVILNSRIDRAHCKPWGLEGGSDATGNVLEIKRNGTWKGDFPNAKISFVDLKPGDSYRIVSGGGGGYGPPWERAVANVQEDVRQGYVSAAKAAEFYGVAIDPETFAVDEAKTERLRAGMRASTGT